MVEQVTCSLQVGKIQRGAWLKHLGHTHSWSRHWAGLSWKILRNSHSVRRYWVGGWLNDARGIAHPVERYWVGGLNYGKKSRNTQGSAEGCQGCSVVGDLMVLAEWIRGWSDTFPRFDCHYRICQDKSEENTWELCSEEKWQDSSWPVSVFSDDWEIYGSRGGLVLILCSGSIGKPTH